MANLTNFDYNIPMKKSLKIVLDTSIFVNPDSRCFFGEIPQKAFSNFLSQLKGKKEISCYIPPSVYEELMKFMENPLPLNKTVLIDKRPPASYQTPIPSLLLHEFIEETRLRVNKGLRIAEKYTRRGLKTNLTTAPESLTQCFAVSYFTP